MILGSIHHLKDLVMTAQAQTAQELRDVNAKLQKASAEIVAQVKALTDALAAAPGETSPEVATAVADLQSTANILDDLNPDPVTP